MEKYGVDNTERTYELILQKPGTPDDFQVIASDLTLAEANKLQNENRRAIIRPEK